MANGYGAQIVHPTHATNLAEILERVLDKGIVVAGDIIISLADVELLKIKIRLLVCSVDKAKEIGIDWWERDPYLSSRASLENQNQEPHPSAQKLEPPAVKNQQQPEP